MESDTELRLTSPMKTQASQTFEINNGISQPTIPITSNNYIPTQQQQKNKHMKTANLPSANTGVNTELKLTYSGATKSVTPQLIPLVISRAKRRLWHFTLLLTIMLGFIQQGFGQSSTPFTANSTFTKPAGVTSVTVEAWGGGGAGGGCSASSSTERVGGGGAGGAMQRGIVNTPNSSYPIVVGTGGTGVPAAAGNLGTNSTFGTTLVVASGGAAGQPGNSSDATGSGASATTGTRNGGGGATGSTTSNYGGGGGGGAGNTGDGQTSTSDIGGTGGTGGIGTTGGDGADGSSSNANGASATTLSGGGAGARMNRNNANYAGGAGFRGQVIVYYYQLTSVSATTPVCVSNSSTVTVNSASLLSSVSYTVTYSLSGTNTATDVSVNMSGTGAGSRTFTVPAASLTNSGTTTVTITQITDGTYAGGINANNTVNIDINAPVTPSVSIATPTVSPICAGTSVTFTTTPTNGGTPTYQWKLNGENVGTGGTTYTTTTLANGDQVSCEMTSTLCASPNPATSNTITMAVNSRPTSNINGTTTVCTGQSATLSINVTATGAWTMNIDNGIGTMTGTGNAVITKTVNPASTTTYTVTSLSDANCTALAEDLGSATVTVNTGCQVVTLTQPEELKAVITGGETINLGESAVITVAITGGTLPYSINGTAQAGTGPFSYTVSPTSTTIYDNTKIIVTDANFMTPGVHCTSNTTGSAVITVNAVAACPANATVCINAASFPLIGASPSGGTYTGTGVSANTFYPSEAGVGIHTLTYSYTDGTNDDCQFTITVNPLPTVSFSTLNATYCASSAPVTITGYYAPSGTFSGPGITDHGNGTATFTPANAGTGGAIVYSYTDANICTNTSTQNVTVNAPPTVSAGSYGPVCSDAADITLVGSPAGGVWTGTGVSGSGSYFFDPSVGTQNLTYSYTDVNGCMSADQTTITVNTQPTVTAGSTGRFVQMPTTSSSAVLRQAVYGPEQG